MNICRVYETKDKKEEMFKLCELEIDKPFSSKSIEYLPIDLNSVQYSIYCTASLFERRNHQRKHRNETEGNKDNSVSK